MIHISSGSLVEINLAPDRAIGGEVVVVGYGYTRGKVRMGAISKVTRTSLFQKAKEIFVKDSIKVFPNPAKQGEMINIKWDKATTGEYRFDLYNLQGQLIQSELSKTEKSSFIHSFRLHAMPAGTYFLKMINKNTNKFFSEKIIVQ